MSFIAISAALVVLTSPKTETSISFSEISLVPTKTQRYSYKIASFASVTGVSKNHVVTEISTQTRSNSVKFSATVQIDDTKGREPEDHLILQIWSRDTMDTSGHSKPKLEDSVQIFLTTSSEQEFSFNIDRHTLPDIQDVSIEAKSFLVSNGIITAIASQDIGRITLLSHEERRASSDNDQYLQPISDNIIWSELVELIKDLPLPLKQSQPQEDDASMLRYSPEEPLWSSPTSNSIVLHTPHLLDRIIIQNSQAKPGDNQPKAIVMDCNDFASLTAMALDYLHGQAEVAVISWKDEQNPGDNITFSTKEILPPGHHRRRSFDFSSHTVAILRTYDGIKVYDPISMTFDPLISKYTIPPGTLIDEYIESLVPEPPKRGKLTITYKTVLDSISLLRRHSNIKPNYTPSLKQIQRQPIEAMATTFLLQGREG